MKQAMSPIGTAARSPALTKGQSPFASPLSVPTSLTAQDLLNNVMGVPRTSGSGDLYRSHLESSAPQPQLLFGSGPPNRPDHSIWSTSLDDKSLKFAGAGTHAGNHYQPSHPHFLSTSSPESSNWPSLYSTGQNLQSHIPATQSSGMFALPPHIPVNNGSHQRSSSSSISVAQFIANQNQNSDDPFVYAPIAPSQQPVPPLGAQPFKNSMEAYSSLIMDADHGTGMPYGHGTLQDYHHNHTHRQRVGHTLAGPPLSSVWGNT